MTSKDSWYSLTENSLRFEDLKMPKLFLQHFQSNDNKMMMHEWASVNCGAVRQQNSIKNNYDKITGVLPKAGYHEELQPIVTKGCNGAIDSEQESMESDTDNTHEVLEYDTDVDEQEITQNEIGNEATFL